MVGVTLQDGAQYPRGQLFFPIVWLLTTSLLVLVLQTIGVPQAVGDAGAASVTNVASDFPLTGIDPAEVEVPSVLYAGVLWSVGESRATDVDGLLERASVEIDATLTNTLESAQLRVPDSTVSLLSTEGPVVTDGRFVDAGARLTLDPGESVEVTIRFELGYTQHPELSTLALQIAEPNRVPASIQLGRAQLDEQRPLFAAVDTGPARITDPDDASRQIVVEPSAASIDVNAGPYRAAIGERLAVVKVRVQRAETTDTPGFLDYGFWALDADGTPTRAILVARSPESASNADEVTLLFAFAEGVEELELIAGADTDAPARFVIVIPSG